MVIFVKAETGINTNGHTGPLCVAMRSDMMMENEAFPCYHVSIWGVCIKESKFFEYIHFLSLFTMHSTLYSFLSNNVLLLSHLYILLQLDKHVIHLFA